MPKYGYLVVEGPHDVEFVYRLLSPFGFARVRLESDLDPFFGPLIPRTYPPSGDLQKRMPVPLFLQSNSHAIAVHSAVGDSRLVQTVEENSALISFGVMTGVGILLDSDTLVTPAMRYASIRDELRAKGFQFPDDAGVVGEAVPRLGAFVLPDNHTQGTLEHILLECAQHVYPTLTASATTHVDAAIQDPALWPEDLDEIGKPAGRNKAIVGSIGSILRPGKAIQVSLQDNRWLRGTALGLPIVKVIQDFLVTLLQLNGSQTGHLLTTDN